MHNPWITGLKFEAANKLHRRHRNGDHENAEDVLALGGERVGGRLQDQVGLSELPSLAEPRRRRELTEIAFGGTLACPFLNQFELAIGQVLLTDEIAANASVRFPRRHETASGGLGD